ncbi:MAG: hypothetical protein RBU30_12250 [Polyangia bacterium]|nr:hypothetical protein [Polyangia bacterium]
MRLFDRGQQLVDKTRVVARSVELTPRVDRFTEHYNLKSRSSGMTRCRTSRR